MNRGDAFGTKVGVCWGPTREAGECGVTLGSAGLGPADGCSPPILRKGPGRQRGDRAGAGIECSASAPTGEDLAFLGAMQTRTQGSGFSAQTPGLPLHGPLVPVFVFFLLSIAASL